MKKTRFFSRGDKTPLFLLFFLVTLSFLIIIPISKADSCIPPNAVPITNWTDLNNIRNNPPSNYLLMNDLSSSTPGYVGIGDNWVPINGKTEAIVFDGYTFYGQGFSIKDLITKIPTLDLAQTQNIGLFGKVTLSFKDLGLENVSINATILATEVGGLLATNPQDSFITVKNCHVTGRIIEEGNGPFTGAFGGDFYGDINNSWASMDIQTGVYAPAGENNGQIGGLLGGLYGNMDNCYFKGNISGVAYLGGLVAYPYVANITNSYAIANITGQSYLGGLAAYPYYTNFNNSYFAGIIHKNDSTYNGWIGGVVGFPDAGNSYTAVGWFNKSIYSLDGTLNETATAIGDGSGVTYNETSVSAFYGNSHPLYSTWDFANNWISNVGNFPTLRNLPSPYIASDTNWDVNLSDSCVISTSVDLGAGNLTLHSQPGKFNYKVIDSQQGEFWQALNIAAAEGFVYVPYTNGFTNALYQINDQDLTTFETYAPNEGVGYAEQASIFTASIYNGYLYVPVNNLTNGDMYLAKINLTNISQAQTSDVFNLGGSFDQASAEMAFAYDYVFVPTYSGTEPNSLIVFNATTADFINEYNFTLTSDIYLDNPLYDNYTDSIFFIDTETRIYQFSADGDLTLINSDEEGYGIRDYGYGDVIDKGYLYSASNNLIIKMNTTNWTYQSFTNDFSMSINGLSSFIVDDYLYIMGRENHPEQSLQLNITDLTKVSNNSAAMNIPLRVTYSEKNDAIYLVTAGDNNQVFKWNLSDINRSKTISSMNFSDDIYSPIALDDNNYLYGVSGGNDHSTIYKFREDLGLDDSFFVDQSFTIKFPAKIYTNKFKILANSVFDKFSALANIAKVMILRTA